VKTEKVNINEGLLDPRESIKWDACGEQIRESNKENPFIVNFFHL